MHRSSDTELRRFAYECAWHLSLQMSIDEIAAATGKSRPTVYRALDQARELLWLDDRPRLTMAPGPERDELERYVTDRYKASMVRDVFGSEVRPSEVIVVPAPPETDKLRLESVVCRAIRASQRYREAYVAPEGPNWEAVLPPLTDEVAQRDEVMEAGGDRDAVARLVREHLEHPYTGRDYERAQRVGRAAAERFCRAVAEGAAKVVGLSWGYHVYEYARAVSMEFPAYGNGRTGTRKGAGDTGQVQLFPLIGSLALQPSVDTREFATTSSANANCVRVARQIGAPDPIALTQPAAIPERFHKPDKLFGVWEYVQEDLSVGLVFGKGLANRRVDSAGQPLPDPAERLIRGEAVELPADALLTRSDTLVSGIGACTWDSRAPRLGLISLTEFAGLGEEAGAIGDLSGQFFWDPLVAPTEANKRRIRRANAHIISPHLGEFIMATRRAKEHGMLGTVVLASGKRKARAVKAACNWGAVNTLIIDSDLADTLCGCGAD